MTQTFYRKFKICNFLTFFFSFFSVNLLSFRVFFLPLSFWGVQQQDYEKKENVGTELYLWMQMVYLQKLPIYFLWQCVSAPVWMVIVIGLSFKRFCLCCFSFLSFIIFTLYSRKATLLAYTRILRRCSNTSLVRDYKSISQNVSLFECVLVAF